MVKIYKKLTVPAAIFAVLFCATNTHAADITLNDSVVKQLDEKSYKVQIDVKNKTATSDNKTESLSKLLKIDNSKLDELIKSDDLTDILEDQLVANIKSDDTTITLDNPFSLHSLLVSLDNKADLNSYPKIKKIAHLIDNFYYIDFDNAVDTKEAYEALKADNRINSVNHDYRIHANDVTLNTKTSWGTATIGADLYTQWLNFLPTKNTVTVAVIDSGINADHKAFSEKSAYDRLVLNDHAYNYADSNDNINDEYGHGTAVAGVIAESTPNNVKILPIRVMDSHGSGNFLHTLLAISDITENKAADIINMSLGMESDAEMLKNPAILSVSEQALSAAKNQGITLVAAAGNECFLGFHINENGDIDSQACYDDIDYPASSASTIAVSAISKTLNFSNAGNIASAYDACGTSDAIKYICDNSLLRSNSDPYIFDFTYSNHGSKVDFSMPGSNLNLPTTGGTSAYKDTSGTSFSSPMLAAAAALIKAEYPSYSPDTIYSQLKKYATDMGKVGKDDFYGWGMIDYGAKMFATPRVTASVQSSTGWTKSLVISGKAVSSSNINGYALTTSSTTPTSWKSITASKIQSISTTATNSAGYYLWVKNANNKASYAHVTVNRVDSTPPSISKQPSVNLDDKNPTLYLTASDSQSGLASITWFYKKTSDSTYNSSTASLDGSTATKTLSLSIANFAKNTSYNAYATIKDAVGNTITSSVITFDTGTGSSSTSENGISNGIYIIHSSKDNKKVIDIAGGSDAKGANVQLYTGNGTPAQKFIIRSMNDGYYEIENLRNIKVLDVAGGGKDNNTNIQQYTSNGSCAQRWQIVRTTDNYYTFVSKCSDKVLDIAAGSTNNGANIQLYTSNNTAAQKFSLELLEPLSTETAIDTGTYTIALASRTDMVLDIAAGSKANSANLQLYRGNNTLAQYFHITPIGNGFYRITNSNSGKVLDVAGGSINNGTNVQQYNWNATSAQQWLIKDLGNDRYSFIARGNLKYLDVAGGSTKDGANLQIYNGNSTQAQIFKLKKRY